MIYNVQAKQLTFDIKDIEKAGYLLLYAIRTLREACNLPLDRYEMKGGLQDSDHAMRAIIEAADCVGIDLGARWGNDLDVRKIE